ncbi:MAG: response regulator [Eubacterium sp.]|nr:response regulator [Eubacterium sp.]
MTDEKDIKVLFLIKSNLSFVNGAIKVFLDEGGISTDVLEISDCISNHPAKMPPLIVSEAGLLKENDKERAFLYDYCIEQASHFVVIDDQDQIDALMEITAPTLVIKSFSRPINAREVAAEIKDLLERAEDQSLRKNVLVVDDSPTFLRTISDWLDEYYNVSVCPSAFAAIKMIASKKPDLILLDYEMPVCTGAQFLEMLNSEDPQNKPPVMFLTSKNDKETVQELLALKPQGYMLKTQPKESILSTIMSYFDKERKS